MSACAIILNGMPQDLIDYLVNSGFVPLGSKPLPQLKLTQISVPVWHYQPTVHFDKKSSNLLTHVI